jgi:hypothetical protein
MKRNTAEFLHSSAGEAFVLGTLPVAYELLAESSSAYSAPHAGLAWPAGEEDGYLCW